MLEKHFPYEAILIEEVLCVIMKEREGVVKAFSDKG